MSDWSRLFCCFVVLMLGFAALPFAWLIGHASDPAVVHLAPMSLALLGCAVATLAVLVRARRQPVSCP